MCRAIRLGRGGNYENQEEEIVNVCQDGVPF